MSFSIKAKFLVSASLLFVASMVLVGVGMVVLNNVYSNTERVCLASRLNQDVLGIEVNHLQWNRSLAGFLLDDSATELKIKTDPETCSYGAWISGEGGELIAKNFPELQKQVADIEAPHARMHLSAKRIIELKANGEREKALEVFRTETSEALALLQEHLRGMRVVFGEALTHEQGSLTTTVSGLRIGVLVMGGFMLLSLCGFIYILYRELLMPIAKISNYSRECLQNTCSVLDIHSRDEIGELAKNITELVDNLQKQLAFSKGVLDGITVPCSIVAADDRIIYTNQPMLDFLERDETPEQCMGMTSGEFAYRDKNTVTITTRALQERKAISATREFTGHKGTNKYISVSSAPFMDSTGELLGTVAIWIDMTEVVSKQRLAEEQQQRMLSVATTARRIAEEVSAASGRMAVEIEGASQGAIAQSERIHVTSTAMGEMRNTIQEVAHSAALTRDSAVEASSKAADGAEVVNHVRQTVTEVVGQSMAVKTSMAALGEQTDAIGEAIDLINEIADQTNLLALNAAIEAARAGESGRGFAVVADEVRKLAEKTMEATKKVEDVVEGIQRGTQNSIDMVDNTVSNIEKVAKLTSEASSSLDIIVALISKAADQVQAIAAAAEEQRAASESISLAVEDVNHISANTSAAMQEASHAIASLSGQADELRALIGQLQG